MAFVLYRIEVSAETRIGEGPSTDVFETTDPDSASPPSFVLAETLSSTVIELSWGYPDIPRGNITGYIIYNDETSGGELNLTLPFMNDMRNQTYVFSGLMPFTNYEFRVAGFAVTEIVTHFGMPSEPVVARTDEDRKIFRFCVCVEFHDGHILCLKWDIQSGECVLHGWLMCMYNIHVHVCVFYTPFATQLYVHVRICTCWSLFSKKI